VEAGVLILSKNLVPTKRRIEGCTSPKVLLSIYICRIPAVDSFEFTTNEVLNFLSSASESSLKSLK
jgi:hypothetical protein